MNRQGSSSRGRPAGLPLLDRQAELGVLARAAADVAAGHGRVVLVEGGAGAGKTRLIAEARFLAAGAGLRVLSARAGELEGDYPYGVVRQLFESAVQGGQGANWLQGPAAQAARVFRPDASSGGEAFATLNGLYWLAANAAARAPLALVVDDLHWADRPSLGFLQFLVRRLEGLPVLLVVAARPMEADVLVDLSASAATDVLRPAPLPDDAAAQLAHELLGVPPTARFVDAAQRATGGNPLLLVELLRALRAERIVPDDAHVGAVGDVGPSAVARIVLVRLRSLGDEALAVAQALALMGTVAEAAMLAEFVQMDEPAVAAAIEALVEAEIVDTELPLGFVHPIVRESIYRDLAPDERDRRHARAAHLLHARRAEPEQVGAHLLLAAPRGLPWVVAALRAAAADASQRGAVETAITFLRRALAERPADADFDLLYRLGMTESAIDPHAAVGHLRAARRATADDGARARIGEMIARMLVFFDPAAAIEAGRQTRAELPADADDARAALLALEHHAGRFRGVASEPYPEQTPDTPRGRMLQAVQAWDLALSGGTAQACAALAAEVLGLSDGRRPALTQDTMFTAVVAGSVLILADDRRAEAFWDDWHAEAVRAGRAHAQIAGGVWHGLMRFRRGRLADAEAAIRGALDGPRAWGPGTETVPAHALSTLAVILVERGDVAGAQAALDRVPEHLSLDAEGALQCRVAELQLRNAEGRYQDGLDGIDPIVGRLETVVNPAWGPWRSLRANALAHVGRTEEAVALAREELEHARRWGTPGPIGRVLTLLGTIEGRVDLLEEAVETTRDPFARLEHAQALLALGGAVRRSRRPTDARALLRDAHDLAAHCDADALARRAREELAAAGGRPRAVAGSGANALTPSERRIAELAAAGRSNRDIAQQLYLSLKTVEFHLSSSYRKLGIGTRRGLAAALEPS